MAHMLDIVNGKATMAYVGQTPWHSLGQELTPGASLAEWTKEAGLDWSVLRAQVLFRDGRQAGDIFHDHPFPINSYDGRDVLYRSDTGAALGVVSSDYNIVQPVEVLSFFDDIANSGGFDLETAGSLSGGRRIWALARINDGAPIIGHDIVRPYLLLTTSQDGTHATTAKLTAIRVVCHNTLTVSLQEQNEIVDKAVNTKVQVLHSARFNARQVRAQLGIFEGTFERWMIQTKAMAEQPIDLDTASEMAMDIAREIPKRVRGPGPVEVHLDESVAYLRIMELFQGAAIGSDIAQGQTKWQFINCVSQWIDHERGRTGAGRLNSAWFGAGNALKNFAYDLVLNH